MGRGRLVAAVGDHSLFCRVGGDVAGYYIETCELIGWNQLVTGEVGGDVNIDGRGSECGLIHRSLRRE